MTRCLITNYVALYKMTDADWLKILLGGIGVLIVAWATWISRSVAGAMSRDEHAKLCEAREERVTCDLEEIKRMLLRQDEEATRSRHQMGGRITKLALQIAALPGIRHVQDESSDGI
jgi:hypothetical protein